MFGWDLKLVISLPSKYLKLNVQRIKSTSQYKQNNLSCLFISYGNQWNLANDDKLEFKNVNVQHCMTENDKLH